MLITDKLNLRKELINLTEKDFYLILNNCELNIIVLGESYYLTKKLIQSSSDNILNVLLKLDIKNELIIILKDLCKLKNSEILFCVLDYNLYLKYKRTKKDEEYTYLKLNKLLSNYDEIKNYTEKVYFVKFFNENIYIKEQLNNETIYEFDVIKIDNQNINNKDIERLNKIFNEDKELIVSNNNQLIKFTNINNTIEYYCYLCEKINET